MLRVSYEVSSVGLNAFEKKAIDSLVAELPEDSTYIKVYRDSKEERYGANFFDFGPRVRISWGIYTGVHNLRSLAKFRNPGKVVKAIMEGAVEANTKTELGWIMHQFLTNTLNPGAGRTVNIFAFDPRTISTHMGENENTEFVTLPNGERHTVYQCALPYEPLTYAGHKTNDRCLFFSVGQLPRAFDLYVDWYTYDWWWDNYHPKEEKPSKEDWLSGRAVLSVIVDDLCQPEEEYNAYWTNDFSGRSGVIDPIAVVVARNKKEARELLKSKIDECEGVDTYKNEDGIDYKVRMIKIKMDKPKATILFDGDY